MGTWYLIFAQAEGSTLMAKDVGSDEKSAREEYDLAKYHGFVTGSSSVFGIQVRWVILVKREAEIIACRQETPALI